MTGVQTCALPIFLKEPDSNLLVPVALSQKALLAALKPVHRSALAAYAGEKSLQLNREYDAIRLLAYYDGL